MLENRSRLVRQERESSGPTVPSTRRRIPSAHSAGSSSPSSRRRRAAFSGGIASTRSATLAGTHPCEPSGSVHSTTAAGSGWSARKRSAASNVAGQRTLRSGGPARLNVLEPIRLDTHAFDHLSIHAKAIVLKQVAEAIPVDKVNLDRAGTSGLV